MSAVRWFLPPACVLAAACSCMSTETDAGDVPGEHSAEVDGEQVGQEGLEAIDGFETPGSDGPEHRDVWREDDEADTVLPEIATMPPACGDGALDPGEECDDGNRLNGDGCDWMCQINSDPFDYPPPDPDARPVEPSGPLEEVVDELEAVTPSSAGFPCHPFWLAAGGGRFALVYNYVQPYDGVRLRILDRSGHTVGEPWSRETSWGWFAQALFPVDDGFGLLSGSFVYGLMRSRFAIDGTPLEEFLTLRPARETVDPWDSLMGGAYSPGRWFAVSSLYGGEYYGWLLESFADDGSPVSRGVISIMNSGLCVSAVSTGTGFATGSGTHVVVLDSDLRVLSWSGTMSGVEEGAEGTMGLSSDGFWVAWSAGHSDGIDDNKSIWVDALDLDGTPRFPPRQILEGLPEAIEGGGTGPGTDVSELAVADGPAGAAVVYWQGVGDGETVGGPVMLVTVDDWGNVITLPTPVLGEGEITTLGYALAAAADDLGYGVVTIMPGNILGTTTLVFRYFAAVP